MGICHGFAVPPTGLSGGEHAVPPVLSRYAPSPDRPPWGTLSPTAYGSGSPLGLTREGRLLKNALAPSPAGKSPAGEDDESVRFDTGTRPGALPCFEPRFLKGPQLGLAA